MAKAPAPIDEVAIKGELTESGLSLAAKSRAVAAFDRLLGGLIDIPAAWLEGYAARNRGKNANQTAILDAEGEAAIKKLNQSQVFGDRLVDAVLAKQVRRQINVEAVAIEAKEALLSNEGGHNAEDKSIPAQLDEDWLNTFEKFAENASTENLRTLWGRILAGEIRKPKSYSLSTLRFLSELDSDMAALFQKAVEKRFPDGFIVKPSNLENNELLDYVFLEEVGLLQEVNGSLSRTWEVGDDGKLIIPLVNILIYARGIKKKRLQVPIIRITRIGREIATILPPPNMIETAKSIAGLLLSDLEGCEIQCLVPNPADTSKLFIMPIEKLK